MTDFATLKAQKNGGRTVRGCPKCGEPNTGQIAILLRELGPGGSVKGAVHLASRSTSFCESCAIETYDGLIASLLGEGEGA